MLHRLQTKKYIGSWHTSNACYKHEYAEIPYFSFWNDFSLTNLHTECISEKSTFHTTIAIHFELEVTKNTQRLQYHISILPSHRMNLVESLVGPIIEEIHLVSYICLEIPTPILRLIGTYFLLPWHIRYLHVILVPGKRRSATDSDIYLQTFVSNCYWFFCWDPAWKGLLLFGCFKW